MNRFTVPFSEIDSRIRSFQKKLQVNAIGGALIVQRVDLFYFSGTAQHAFLFIPADDEPLLMVKKYYPRAVEESSIKRIVELPSIKQLPHMIQYYYGKLPEVIGFELDVIPVNEYEFFKALLPAKQYGDVSPLILECRMIKSDWELEQIQKTAVLSAQTFEYIKNTLDVGISEMEFSGKIETYARRLGHGGRMRTRHYQTEAYPWHILSGTSGGKIGMLDAPASGEGTSCAFPCGSGPKLLNPNEPIMVDFSFMYNGYHTDETRMFAIGSMPDIAYKASQAAIEIQTAILTIIKPGISANEVFQYAEKVAHSLGYADTYLGPVGYKVSFVGHGIGLELIEPPFIARNKQDILQSGMVFAIEPKFVFKDQFCAGIESMIRVTDTGATLLSQISNEVFTVKTRP